MIALLWQVTGVISVKDNTRKKKRKKPAREGSLRQRISETIGDTLRRAGRRKRTSHSVRVDIPNFLFVNKPHFSSDESLVDHRRELERLPRPGRRERTRGISEPREVSEAGQRVTKLLQVGGKQYRSELMLRAPSRLCSFLLHLFFLSQPSHMQARPGFSIADTRPGKGEKSTLPEWGQWTPRPRIGPVQVWAASYHMFHILSSTLTLFRGDYVVYSEVGGVRKKSRARRLGP